LRRIAWIGTQGAHLTSSPRRPIHSLVESRSPHTARVSIWSADPLRSAHQIWSGPLEKALAEIGGLNDPIAAAGWPSLNSTRLGTRRRIGAPFEYRPSQVGLAPISLGGSGARPTYAITSQGWGAVLPPPFPSLHPRPVAKLWVASRHRFHCWPRTDPTRRRDPFMRPRGPAERVLWVARTHRPIWPLVGLQERG
jgi:hypothetical protein